MDHHWQVGWGLILLGLIIAGIGISWMFAPHLSRFGRLPGDIVIEGKNSRFYFPITTCILISLVLSLVSWLIRKWAR
jgi:hypothetical protein